MQDSDFEEMLVILGYDSCSASGRVLHSYTVSLAYQSLSSEIASLADWPQQLAAKQQELRSLYEYSDVVTGAPETNWTAIGVYQDAVSFAWDRKDGALGFWIHNLVTGRRHLAVAFRKKHRCRWA